MELKAKLNFKFYIVALLLLGGVVFSFYGIVFLNVNQILMEDDTPMDSSTKALFTTVLSAVAVSWALSFLTLVRQMILRYAFILDDEGIKNTSSAMIVMAFIFVAPVKAIPYEAIKGVTSTSGRLSITIDKSKIEALPILKIFVSPQYNFFMGFTAVNPQEIKAFIETKINVTADCKE